MKPDHLLTSVKFHESPTTIANLTVTPEAVVCPESLKTAPTSGKNVLPAGASATFLILVRGDKVGKHVLRFLFAYKSSEAAYANIVGFRKLRSSVPLTIQRSIKISAFTRPSQKVTKSYLLGIEVSTNKMCFA